MEHSLRLRVRPCVLQKEPVRFFTNHQRAFGGRSGSRRQTLSPQHVQRRAPLRRPIARHSREEVATVAMDIICGEGFCGGTLATLNTAKDGHVHFLQCRGCGRRNHAVQCRCGATMGQVSLSMSRMEEGWKCTLCGRLAELQWTDIGLTVKNLIWRNEPAEPVSTLDAAELIAAAEEVTEMVRQSADVPQRAPATQQHLVSVRCRVYRKETGEETSVGRIARAMLLFTVQDHPLVGTKEYLLKIGPMSPRVFEQHIATILRSLTVETKGWLAIGALHPEKDGFVAVGQDCPVSIRIVPSRERTPDVAE